MRIILIMIIGLMMSNCSSSSYVKNKKNTLIVLAWNFYKDIIKNNSDLSENFINIKDLESNN